MPELQPCGTPAAARRHRRKREPVCELCRVAESEHSKLCKRNMSPAQKVRERKRLAAYMRAKQRLAQEFPQRFMQIVLEEEQKVGYERREQ